MLNRNLFVNIMKNLKRCNLESAEYTTAMEDLLANHRPVPGYIDTARRGNGNKARRRAGQRPHLFTCSCSWSPCSHEHLVGTYRWYDDNGNTWDSKCRHFTYV